MFGKYLSKLLGLFAFCVVWIKSLPIFEFTLFLTGPEPKLS
jgi:hypothetical protein